MLHSTWIHARYLSQGMYLDPLQHKSSMCPVVVVLQALRLPTSSTHMADAPSADWYTCSIQACTLQYADFANEAIALPSPLPLQVRLLSPLRPAGCMGSVLLSAGGLLYLKLPCSTAAPGPSCTLSHGCNDKKEGKLYPVSGNVSHPVQYSSIWLPSSAPSHLHSQCPRSRVSSPFPALACRI